MFSLAPQLENDSEKILDLALCEWRLINDSQYPWTILIPRVEDIEEITQLSSENRIQFWKESDLVSRVMIAIYQPDKLNVAALGNVVRQLHLHHVARFVSDISWPGPVWGHSTMKPYEENEKLTIVNKLKEKYLDLTADTV